MIDDLIAEWIKGILIDGIKGNLSGLFGTVTELLVHFVVLRQEE